MKVASSAGWLAAGLLLAAGASGEERAGASEAEAALDQNARLPASRVEVAPAVDGTVGCWLLLGPFALPRDRHAPTAPTAVAVPPGVQDDLGLQPVAGASLAGKAWGVASSADGRIDLRAALHARGGDLVAYAAGTLHVERRGRYLLLFGADDGLRVSIDRRVVLSRDESRPPRDDDDVVPVDLEAGDHALLLRLHQRDGAWALRARLLDEHLAPPAGAYLALPGTSGDDARSLAGKLATVTLDRGLDLRGEGYRPVLTVGYAGGAPRGVPLEVKARLAARGGQALLDVGAGEVPLDARGVGELTVRLPAVGEGEALVDDQALGFEVTVAGRTTRVPFAVSRRVHAAVLRATRALSAVPADARWMSEGARESVEAIRDRLVAFVSRGDVDREAQDLEARELDALAADLERGVDPYARRVGAMRRALAAPFDGKPAPFGLYVPPSYRPGSARRYPLVVGLHGLNGRPMAMIRYMFGFDDPKLENEWEDRHPVTLPPFDAFLVTPSGYGNTMYRDLGEDDALRLVAWALARYPIDPDRVTITGMSMGGIGSASIPLHHPDVFAAAAPLCGYHSYFVRRDIAGHALRPWEKSLAEERSNASWADNGARLPLYVVHGTLDLPQENSGVLIDRYEKLGYSVVHEHPPLGHNVWQRTYEDEKGLKWLVPHVRRAHPAEVTFRTLRLRDGDDAWVHVDELGAADDWGEVTARAAGGGRLSVKTKGVAALHLDRDAKLGTGSGAVTVRVDDRDVAFDPEAPLVLHREAGGGWAPGPAHHDGPWKHGHLTGPIRDVFHEPVLFVYGASAPSDTRANEEVARQWAAIRYGVTVAYPVMSDVEFFARGEALGNDRALFLVGSARTNAVVRALEPKLPLRVDGDAVVLGDRRITGREVGAAFIVPNPERQDRYVVVLEGVDAPGTWRSLSLPDLIPDFVVYDADVGPARGQMILGSGTVRAAGFFTPDWRLPASVDDPLAHADRPGARSEHEATPYLP